MRNINCVSSGITKVLTQKHMANAIPTRDRSLERVDSEDMSEIIALSNGDPIKTLFTGDRTPHIESCTLPSLSPPIALERRKDANDVDWIQLMGRRSILKYLSMFRTYTNAERIFPTIVARRTGTSRSQSIARKGKEGLPPFFLPYVSLRWPIRGDIMH